MEDTRKHAAHPTILVVEDEPALRAVLVEAVAAEGFDVREAPNADAALILCDTHPVIHVLLTDARMPGSMDRVELARRVRAIRPEIAVMITWLLFAECSKILGAPLRAETL